MPAVYRPTALFGLGRGVVLPVPALSATELGASVGTATPVAALAGLGQPLADLPAGALTSSVGEHRAMVGASVVTAVSPAGSVVAPDVALLGSPCLRRGGASVCGLARQSFPTEATPVHMRARALSSLGGVQRIGTIRRPLLGAFGHRTMGY